MIDLHSHILPGLDDGPETLDQSVEMARLYEKTGFKAVVATPHWINGSQWMPAKERIHTATDLLNNALELKKIKLTIHPGMEIALDADLANHAASGRLLSLAGQSYLLIEAPFQRLPMGWEHVVGQLISSGFNVLLAHPERCSQLQQHPELFDRIIDAGIYIQVNCGSFTGEYGMEAEQTAGFLADKGYIHCLATDAHDRIWRSPKHAVGAGDRIEKRIGTKNLRLMLLLNPLRVLEGTPLEPPEIQKYNLARKKQWRRP